MTEDLKKQMQETLERLDEMRAELLVNHALRSVRWAYTLDNNRAVLVCQDARKFWEMYGELLGLNRARVLSFMIGKPYFDCTVAVDVAGDSICIRVGYGSDVALLAACLNKMGVYIMNTVVLAHEIECHQTALNTLLALKKRVPEE